MDTRLVQAINDVFENGGSEQLLGGVVGSAVAGKVVKECFSVADRIRSMTSVSFKWPSRSSKAHWSRVIVWCPSWEWL